MTALNRFAPAILAALLGAAPLTLAGTAQAGGQLALSIQPRNAQEAQMLRMGLAIYALRQDIRSNGHVTQVGVNNAAGIAQGGPNNQAIIHQEGCNHTGTINQQGGNNAHGLFQFGCNTTGHVSQHGNSTGLTFILGF